jgi:hypothetical protein
LKSSLSGSVTRDFESSKLKVSGREGSRLIVVVMGLLVVKKEGLSKESGQRGRSDEETPAARSREGIFEH